MGAGDLGDLDIGDFKRRSGRVISGQDHLQALRLVALAVAVLGEERAASRRRLGARDQGVAHLSGPSEVSRNPVRQSFSTIPLTLVGAPSVITT
jgi:hypothetical protein